MDKKTRVMYLLEYSLNTAGGVQTMTDSMASELSKNANYEVCVVCGRMEHTISKNYGVFQFDAKAELKATNQLREIVNSWKPDIIHVQMLKSLILITWLKKSWQIGRNVHIIFEDHSLLSGYSSKSRLLFRLTIRNTWGVVVTNEYNCRLWKHMFPQLRINVLPNTTSREFEQPILQPSFEDSIFRIGFVGRMVDMKNWPIVSEIVKELNKQTHFFCVRLAFGTYDDDEHQDAELLTKTVCAIIGENRVIKCENLSSSEMVGFYDNIDAFVMTSKFEPFGKTSIEAMARGKTVLGFDIPGSASVIEKKENLFCLNDINGVVAKLFSYINDRQSLVADQRYFYRRYYEFFSIDRTTEIMTKIYETCMGHAV